MIGRSVSTVVSAVNSVQPARTDRTTSARSYTASNGVAASSTMKFAGRPSAMP